MSDSLMSYSPKLPQRETRTESLIRQFYEWERRGRGWEAFNYPVELEPPFVPFYSIDPAANSAVDDGRQTTFLSRLFDNLTGKTTHSEQSQNNLSSSILPVAEIEPVVCDYFRERFIEFELILPKETRVAKSVAEQLLSSFSYAACPISFEVVGTEEKIAIQFAATEADAAQIRQQISAHLPTAIIAEREESFLVDAWCGAGNDFSIIADFGLSKEFMLPLAVVASFDTDPLVAITGALADLSVGEVGVFQILFQRTRFDWAEEILNSVRFFDGTPFFANAPEMISLARQKTNRPLYAVCIRAAAKSFVEQRAWRIVRNLGAALASTANPIGNELIPLTNDGYDTLYHERALLDRTSHRLGMILNSEELVSFVHPPSPAVQSAKLARDGERTKAAPQLSFGHSFIVGENNHRGMIRQVSLSDEQRAKHIHLIGSSGSGKSTLMLNLIRQDLNASRGFCVIDPHGDLIDAVMENIPENRIRDVILFDPSDSEYPIGFNILQANSELEKTLLASDLIAVFRRMSTSWGDVMDSVLANAILAFVESADGGTLFDLKRFLVEKDFRESFLETVEDDAIRYFWINEFPLIAGKPQSSILIRLDAFLRQKLIRYIVCQKDTRINFREIIDNRKILLVKLAQGAIGEENSHLLGTLLMSKLYQTALSRQDTRTRPFFSCYLDEFHHFITPSMENILSGVRKYNLGLVLAHQEFRQLQSRNAEVASSVLSNCYTRICFRLGDADAERFASGFSFFDAGSLQNLSVGEAVGRVERAEFDFNLTTNPLPEIARDIAAKRRAEIVAQTRERYARARTEVEADLTIWRTIRQADEEMPKGKARPVEAKTTAARAPEIEEKPDGSFAEKAAREIEVPKEKAGSTPPASLPPQAASSDKDTQSHRYLQSLVKRMAESKGFLATVEKEVFGGVGKIDVALEKENQKIACEVSITNEAGYELQNIRKCLSAGYHSVIVISADGRHLEKIKKLAAENLTGDDLAKTQFFTPEAFHSWLENLETADANSQEKVKGFKVNVRLKPVDERSVSTKKRAISDVIFGGLKKLKNKSGDK